MAIPPAAAGGDNVDTTIETPEGAIQIISDAERLGGGSDGLPDNSIALFVTSDPTNGQVQLIALTNIGFQFSGMSTPILLQGGQTVTILDGQLGPIQNFDLRRFLSNLSVSCWARTSARRSMGAIARICAVNATGSPAGYFGGDRPSRCPPSTNPKHCPPKGSVR